MQHFWMSLDGWVGENRACKEAGMPQFCRICGPGGPK